MEAVLLYLYGVVATTILGTLGGIYWGFREGDFIAILRGFFIGGFSGFFIPLALIASWFMIVPPIVIGIGAGVFFSINSKSDLGVLGGGLLGMLIGIGISIGLAMIQGIW